MAQTLALRKAIAALRSVKYFQALSLEQAVAVTGESQTITEKAFTFLVQEQINRQEALTYIAYPTIPKKVIRHEL
jgi:hypothetical protein